MELFCIFCDILAWYISVWWKRRWNVLICLASRRGNWLPIKSKLADIVLQSLIKLEFLFFVASPRCVLWLINWNLLINWISQRHWIESEHCFTSRKCFWRKNFSLGGKNVANKKSRNLFTLRLWFEIYWSWGAARWEKEC